MTIRAKSIVPKVGEPDIDESYIRQQDAVLLETLLIDRTMTAVNDGNPVNIKWAIDDYAREFPDATGYSCEDPITIDAISREDGRDLKVVTPRVKKRKEEQELRTAQKAEVFTPSWICNEQNNLVDEAWFGRKDNLFNKPNPDFKAGLDFGADFPQLRWKATYCRHSIPFLHNKKGRTWRDYVKALWLEVSCGEAPYLTSRYDTTTGKWIEPRSRIGFLDRNLDGTVEVRVKPCKGCDRGDAKKHNGVRCRVMDWETGKPVLFMPPFEFKPIEE